MNKRQKREFNGISRRAQQALRREEGFDVEFKESLNGLESADLVAFANSPTGGIILIGVKETKTAAGRQKGIVVGCAIADAEKRKVLDKAANCTPPIDLSIFVENTETLPFYRIEIPPSRNRPHCTLSGLYSIRGDGRKKRIASHRASINFP